MENKEALEHLNNKYYNLKDLDSNKTYQFIITDRNTGKKETELLKKIDELWDTINHLRNNITELEDEIDYLKDDIDMEKGVNEHLKSVLDRTEYLLEYEKAKNKELEAKIIALSIKGEK